ncbi:hypothetical protein [Blastococcus mobilis]|uniref:Uncharacterized protein n=1 Tax=Blastococcus mobilis TaxID=1938746 RepID=A0A238X763_9ACTN|nr:hypothetical protein [Blastococcus mobilis]SNR54876.1 hypothetical protein SAMN06272737_11226 [Blastococcus mobilis]
MTANPYAVPVDQFVARARVPLVDQVELQPEAQQPPADWSTDVVTYGGDVDGE